MQKIDNTVLVFGIIFICLIIILCFSILSSGKHYLVMSILIVVLSMLPLFAKFEKRNVKAEEIVIIAMLSSIAAISRIPFASIPSVQPTSFVIIMSALTFDKEVGFMVGSTAAIVSNIFLGQGPWTPWQMFCWGMMGYSAGVLRDTRFIKSKLGIKIFGFIWGFIFGWIMNLWFVLYFNAKDITWKIFLASCIASFRFDLYHGLSNIVFISLFKNRWKKILGRVKVKYGL